MTRKHAVAALGLLLVASCAKYVVHGSLFSRCIYTEEAFAISDEIVAGTFELTRTAFQRNGGEPEYACLPVLGQVANGLVGRPRNGSNAAENAGLTYQGIEPAMARFRLSQVIVTQRRGITAFLGGSGRLTYLILTDPAGVRYRVFTVDLGINEGERFMQLILPGRALLLDGLSFETRFSERKLVLRASAGR